IQPDVSKDFLIKNHLMGNGKGKCFGLIHNSELVCLIQIINKKDFIDVSRFSSALGVSVQGGLSKLLKHISNLYKKDIVSFVDMRYGDGHSLEKIGFKKISCYESFYWTDFVNTFHRLNFKGNSGYDFGLRKIWDCGQSKYLKEYEGT